MSTARNCAAACVVTALVLAGTWRTGVAQSERARELPGMSWSAIAELPDFSGPWGDYEVESGRFRGGRLSEDIPFNAAARSLAEDFRARVAAGEETTQRTQTCQAPRFSGVMGGPEAYLEFLYTPGRVTITNESGLLRRIYTDGREIPDDPHETFHGTSIGRWEGDALIVETVGLDRNNSFAANIPAGAGFRVVERIRLTPEDRLQIDSSIIAPAILTGPYEVSKQFVRHGDYTMHEFNCSQNNRDVDPATGKQIFDLTPPEDLPPPPSSGH